MHAEEFLSLHATFKHCRIHHRRGQLHARRTRRLSQIGFLISSLFLSFSLFFQLSQCAQFGLIGFEIYISLFSCHLNLHSVRAKLRLNSSPHQCNILLGGYEEAPDGDGLLLYLFGYLGTLVNLLFAAEGCSQYFVLSMPDCCWQKNLSLDEDVDAMMNCIAQV